MALFGNKKKEEAAASAGIPVGLTHKLVTVLKAPRITEKATLATDKGAYVFNVERTTTKGDIAKAVQAIYKVTPVKVNVVNSKQKKVAAKGRGAAGKRSGERKAYVYLKKGETIEIV